MPGLTENKDYEFRVKAKNAGGFSQPSIPTSFKVRAKFTVPSPPKNVTVTKVGKTYVDLKWEKPDSDGGSRITGYIIERRDLSSPSAQWIKANDYNPIDCEYTVLNLTENNNYEFRVFAVNAAGKSGPSQCTSPVKVTDIVDGAKPEFVRKLLNKNTSLNKGITLECEGAGKPIPTARWFRNGQEIHPAGRIKAIATPDAVYKLTFSEVWESDEGEYTCEISNPLGSDRCSAKLTIASPPKVERCPNEVYFPEHDNGKVKIFFSGTAPLEISLFKDGLEVQESTHLKFTIFDDYVIIFLREALKTDEGKYKLVVSNASGSDSGTFALHVTGLPGPPQGPLEVSDINKNTATISWRPPAYDGGRKVTHYIVERKETSRNQWVIASSYCKDTICTLQGLTEGGEYLFRVMAVNENGQSKPLDGTNPVLIKSPYDPPSAPGVPQVTEVGGDFVNLSWEKPQSDGGSRIQGYWIDKREVGTQTWQRVNPNICITPQINISNLIEDRQYEFRVFAVNEAGISPPSTNSNSIRIKDPDAPQPPEFTLPLRTVMAIENKRAEFHCRITGNPKPHVTWYKGMRELFEGGKYSMLRDGESYTLVIGEVYGEDADEYCCRASNKGGTRTSRAELLIKTAPHIHVPPRFRELANFEKGENITLKIPFTGFPKPKLKWSREGEEIESGGHYDVQFGERHAILVIRDVTKLDSGPYRLVAENELGVDSAIIKIQISDKPDPPRFPIIENVSDDSVTLSWKPPLWDGGSHVTNYLIEKREVPLSSWIRCGNTRFLYHLVSGLNPGKDYEFRIYAENVYGRSDPSDPTTVITTKQSGKDRHKRKQYTDASGRRIRGKPEGKVTNYDQYVFDIDKYIPGPVDIKTSSVYDFYDILEEIGTGAFGVVHRCREKRTGNIFAAKFIPITHPLEKSVIKKEIDIMNQLHHPKLIRLHDAFEDDDEMILIYEFMAGGELFERITDDNYKMSEAEVINYMRQICEGVKHMHEKNIVHLDIKPENIMCQTKAGNNIKMIDFGLATKLDPKEIVKISTGTAEFAAPEIVDREPVGFYTDMWAVGVLAYVLLSGLSPFAGDNDVETLKNVRACDWEFDDEAFATISSEAKDFIKRLLTRNKEKRMTAHECLEHPWLKGAIGDSATIPIPNRRYIKFRDSIRARYGDYWFSCVLPIGHISNYSSLRKLHQDKYKISDFYFDRQQAAPRFVIRPQSTFVYEGQSANFYCRVIAAAPAVVSWFRDNLELRLSVKYMKRYQDDDYWFIINRCKLDDRGEYVIRAENSYGYREQPVLLNVQSIPVSIPEIRLDEPIRKRQEPLYFKPWEEPKDSPPNFTFLLRPRVIQSGIGVKLLCCLTGKPTPEIKWYKNGREVNKYECSLGYADGVATLEIASCSGDDAGKYTCRASNKLGDDETSCFVIVEDHKSAVPQSPVIMGSPLRVSTPTRQPFSNVTDIYKRDYSSAYSSKSSDYSHSYSSSDQKYSSSTKKTSSDYVSSTLSSAASRLSVPETTKRVQKPYGKKEGTSPTRSRTATKELEIPEDTPMTAPSFKESLRDQSIKDGETMILKCVIDGDPEPNVEWLKDGRVLHSSEIMNLKYKNKEAMLIIAEVYPEDAGEYTCKARNSLGEISSKCKITILPMEKKVAAAKKSEGPLRVVEHLISEKVKDGSAVTLRCRIKGPPKFEVVWLHDDKEIKSSKDFQYKNEGDVYELIIPEIYPEDTGSYTCDAFDTETEAFTTCMLDVEVPGEEPKGPQFSVYPQSITVAKGEPASLTATTKKAAKSVEWFKDGKPLDTSSPRYKLTKEKNKISFSIPSTVSTDVGQYTVCVKNESGESKAVASINILTDA